MIAAIVLRTGRCICGGILKGPGLKHAKAFLIALAIIAVMAFAACASSSVSETGSAQASDQLSGSATSQADSASQDKPTDAADFSARTKTWVVLGDSLTKKYFRAKTAYYDYVAQDIGCTIVNYGETGTGYKEHSRTEPFYERVDRMDVSDVDCLTIFGSFNDLGKGYSLGSAYDETTDTIGGCMNLTIQNLIKKNPGLRIGIVTPTPWRTNYCYTPDGANFYGTTRYECDSYVSLLKEVAKRHRLPVLDLYETFGLDPDDEEIRKRFYTEDGKTDDGGVHPNSEGHKFMYPMWREFVKTLMASDAVS